MPDRTALQGVSVALVASQVGSSLTYRANQIRSVANDLRITAKTKLRARIHF